MAERVLQKLDVLDAQAKALLDRRAKVCKAKTKTHEINFCPYRLFPIGKVIIFFSNLALWQKNRLQNKEIGKASVIPLTFDFHLEFEEAVATATSKTASKITADKSWDTKKPKNEEERGERCAPGRDAHLSAAFAFDSGRHRRSLFVLRGSSSLCL
ncbi:uncharacterized protein C1orf141 homolog [Erethizon dorsatum]